MPASPKGESWPLKSWGRKTGQPAFSQGLQLTFQLFLLSGPHGVTVEALATLAPAPAPQHWWNTDAPATLGLSPCPLLDNLSRLTCTPQTSASGFTPSPLPWMKLRGLATHRLHSQGASGLARLPLSWFRPHPGFLGSWCSQSPHPLSPRAGVPMWQGFKWFLPCTFSTHRPSLPFFPHFYILAPGMRGILTQATPCPISCSVINS